MKTLVENIAKSLVDHPEDVSITEVEHEDITVLELRANPDDLGKIIGKQGRIAKAIRTVVKAASIKNGKKVTVEIL